VADNNKNLFYHHNHYNLKHTQPQDPTRDPKGTG
jgi:hypothetical protein